MVTFVRKPQTAKKPDRHVQFWRTAFPGQAELPWWLAVVAVTLIGLFFRLVYIIQPVGFDEAYTFLAFSRQPYAGVFTDYTFPNNHILHTFLVKLVTNLIPIQSIWVMRLPALLAGVLSIPAAYLAGRSLYNNPTGVISAVLVAASPLFINFSAEARGYTLLSFFSLVMLWLAAVFTRRTHWTGWLVFILSGVLGALTIPIMLYPLAAIFVWMVVNAQITSETSEIPRQKIWPIFFSALAVFAGTLMVYSPVILVGTGYKSLTANGFVAPRPWDEFFPDLISRLQLTWSDWQDATWPPIMILLTVGFLLSFLFHHRITFHRVHLAVPTVGSLAIIVLLQQVAPLPRIWQFLQGWFFIWAGAGWMGLITIFSPKRRMLIQTVFTAAFSLVVLTDRTADILKEDYLSASQPGVEESVAWILADIRQEGELIAALVPSSTQIKYYYNQKGDFLADFYYNENPAPFSQILAVVNTKYDETLDDVVQRHKLTGQLDLETAIRVGGYKQVEIYRLSKTE